MKRINFRRVLSFVACLTMLIGTLISPATTAKADEAVAGGYLHRANSYDWGTNGHANAVFAFASTDENASASTIIGQAPGTFGWWYSLVLEYNEARGTFVVTVSDMEMDGVNATETATLGYGKLSLMFHGDLATTHADSYNYFIEHAEVGTEFYLVGDYDAILATADVMEGVYLTTEKPESYWIKPGTTPSDEPVTGAEGGYLHRANSYDWDTNGHANAIFSFASNDAQASISSIIGQAPGTYAWWYGIILEYDAAKDAFVVTVSDLDSSDGVNAVETATLGYGKLAILFHGDVAGVHPESFEYFTTYATLGREFKLVGDYDAIIASSDVLTDVYLVAGEIESMDTPEPTPEPTPTPAPQIESTVGYLTRSNSHDWMGGHLKDILVLTSDDPELMACEILGQAPGTFAWWYGLVLEYNEEKGVFVVTAADVDPSDGVCPMEGEKLGYGKMVILFHGDVVGKQPESFAYFTTHAEIGTEHYLIGDYDEMILCYDKLADTSLTTEKPASYWTKPDPTPTPEPTPTTAPTQAPDPAPVVQENPGVNPIVIAVIIVAVVAVAGVVFVVIKKRK